MIRLPSSSRRCETRAGLPHRRRAIRRVWPTGRGQFAIGCLLISLLAIMPAAQSVDPPAVEDAWPLANHDLSSTRFASASGLDRANVKTLHAAWRYRLHTPPGEAGALTATPAVAAGVVFVQDMQSNVIAIDLQRGSLRWEHRFSDTSPGPNGVVVVGDRVYGATDTSAFALSASTGQQLWRHLLVTEHERFVDVAPRSPAAACT